MKKLYDEAIDVLKNKVIDLESELRFLKLNEGCQELGEVNYIIQAIADLKITIKHLEEVNV